LLSKATVATCSSSSTVAAAASTPDAQLAEAFSDEAGKPRNRVIATLGRVDKDDPNINSVLAGPCVST
jgi:hypothetical protein